jgi:beta-glucanase (GH16 family)
VIFVEKYTLTFEEYFKNGGKDYEIVEIDELEVDKTSKGDVMPDFVKISDEIHRGDTYVRFIKDNVKFQDGKLALYATKDDIGYAGGAVKYKGRRFGKGLLEVKAKMPATMPGIWPKIFINGKNKNTFTDEIFAQIKGINDGGKNSFALWAYYTDAYGEHKNEYLHSGYQRWPSFYPTMDTDEPLSEGYHVYGYEKTDIDAIFYMDGKECFRIDISHPMFTVFDCDGELNFSLGANLPRTEACCDETILPCAMEVEYVKFYEEVK